MRSSSWFWWSRSFIAFLLKFLNFLQAFVGVWFIIYSIWMFSHWNKHGPIPHPPPSAPSPENADYLTPLLNSQYPAVLRPDSDVIRVQEHVFYRKLGVEMASGFDGGVQFDLNTLPVPWFIYWFMGIGILLCFVTCIGYIAAEAINACCLCFYTMLTFVIIAFEAALVGFIAFHKHWDEDLPYDPTGELDSLRSFIDDNIDLCRWVGLAVIFIQALSLLLSIILRAMVSSRIEKLDSDDENPLRGESWQPLINSQGGQTSALTSTDSKGIRPHTWSTRMRQKYGLNMSAFTFDH
ncbi:hypothetical protein AAC387_Pa08g1365 [Persea americana]